jgi:hypothetical protein
MANFFGKTRNFFIRFSILAIVLLWNVIRLNNIDKSSDELRDKLSRSLSYYGMLSPGLKEFVEDPSLILLLGLLADLIFNVMAIFGSYRGAVLSGIMFLINNLIYFNPLLPEYQISLYNTRIEVLTNIGVMLSIFMFAYYPYEDKIVKPLSEEELDQIEENEDSKDKKFGKKKRK